jgi:hypothetical protein
VGWDITLQPGPLLFLYRVDWKRLIEKVTLDQNEGDTGEVSLEQAEEYGRSVMSKE